MGGIRWLLGRDSVSAPRLVDGIWQSAPNYEPAGFSAGRRDHLAEIEQAHFWFPPRRKLLTRLLDDLLPLRDARLLELGCGTGDFLTSFVEAAGTSDDDSEGRRGDPPRSVAQAVGVEGHLLSLQGARKRSESPVWIHGDATAVPLESEQFDVVVALDVLEHAPSQSLLREAHRLVRPGGAILLSVPAFPSLWSPLDEAAGHRKRYRIADLRAECAGSGWQIEGHTHYQCLLFPLVWATRRLHRTSAASGSSASLERRPPAGLSRALLGINSFEVKTFAGRTLPFGSSLVAWGRKSSRTMGDGEGKR